MAIDCRSCSRRGFVVRITVVIAVGVDSGEAIGGRRRATARIQVVLAEFVGEGLIFALIDRVLGVRLALVSRGLNENGDSVG